MRLTDLQPKWIKREEQLVGVTFLCPHCLKFRLVVAFAPLLFHEQMDLIHALIGMEEEEKGNWIPAKSGYAWKYTGTSFEALSITPSVDASKSGHWHGHVTSGAIVGASNIKVYVNNEGTPKLKPGEWAWVIKDALNRRPILLAFGCPCGDTHGWNGYIAIAPYSMSDKGVNWRRDGNFEFPTLFPSIKRNTECGWHGYMDKGVFVKERS